MPVVVLFVKLVLGGVFALAALAKLADRSGTKKAVADFGVPPALARTGALLLPPAELLVALLLVLPGTGLWGGAGALALLAAFSGAIGVSLARGRTPDCRCFGQLRSAPIGWPTLLRNGAFAAGASLVVWQERGGPGIGIAEAAGVLLQSTLAAGLVVGLTGLALAAQGWLIVHLFRQQGRLLLRVDTLESALESSGLVPSESQQPQPGLPVGSSAPDFELPALAGAPVSLDRLLRPGKPVVLIFTDPGCTPCNALVPDVARWEREHAGDLTFALLSRGTVRDNREKRAIRDLKHVLLQRNREVAERYGADGTPSALVVHADGSIGSPVAMGAGAIAELVSRAVRGELLEAAHLPSSAAHPPAPAGVPFGQPAPRFRVLDLDGAPVETLDLRGQATLLLFWNPACGFCNRMLPELKGWERARSERSLRMVIVSTGAAESNRAMGVESRILLDPGFTVGRAFGVTGTPSAVLIDADGRVASNVAIGAEQVLALASLEPVEPLELTGAGTTS